MHGETALWAYGSRAEDTPFPLIIVPYDLVLARAVDAENYINQQIDIGLKISAALTIFVVLATIILAIVRARKVTDPVMELAQAATRLAAGDFNAKVNIRSSDELIRLGQIFNSLGDSLKEREQLKQSLALAKEIQQELLPASAPATTGFDIVGTSHYCDETGGDYYDFISLQEKDVECTGLAIGDVSGHGIGSALVMAAARGILRSLADHNPLELTPLFASLNRHLSRDTADDSFMTLFMACSTHRPEGCVGFQQARPLFSFIETGRSLNWGAQGSLSELSMMPITAKHHTLSFHRETFCFSVPTASGNHAIQQEKCSEQSV